MKRKRKRPLFFIAFALLLLLLLAGSGWLLARRRLTRTTLLVEARLSSVKEEQPASRATLYLLERDMMKLALVEAGGPSPLQERVFSEHPKLRHLAALMNVRRREAYSLGPEVLQFVEQSRPLWQPHVLYTTETDMFGRAHFYNLKPGDYWLVCRAETRGGGVAFWNLYVSLHRGEQTVTLEPFNSLQCTACR
jgi:hypothetical protein